MLNRQALAKLKGVPLLLKYLAAFCVLHNVGATSIDTSVTPPPSCSCTAELEAMAAEAARVAEQTAADFEGLRKFVGTVPPSSPPSSPPSPPSPSPPPPSPPPPSPGVRG